MHIIIHNNAQYYIDCNLVGKGNLKTKLNLESSRVSDVSLHCFKDDTIVVKR